MEQLRINMEQLRINNLQYNKTLGEILKENGVSINEFENYWEIANNELLGKGQWGKVFDISNNKVLKISQDDYEYKAIKILLDEVESGNDWFKHILNLPLVVCPVNENFYTEEDIKNAHPWGLHKIRYYYIQEKLYQLSDYERKIFEEVEDFYNSGFYEDMEYTEGDEADIEEYIKRKYPNFAEYYIIEFLINVFNFVEEIPINDIHLDNIMKDINGNLKLIDLRYV